MDEQFVNTGKAAKMLAWNDPRRGTEVGAGRETDSRAHNEQSSPRSGGRSSPPDA